MTNARFIQIHTLSSYPAALLNRDDAGLAKRMPYGGAIRTRISSQCLKRHWRVDRSGAERMADIDGAEASVRSRETVTKRVFGPLRAGGHDDKALKAIEDEIQKAVYGDKATDAKSRQPLLLGEPEIRWLAEQAHALAAEYGSDAKAAAEAAKDWSKGAKANMKAMRDAAALPGGLTAALFGRMVTADPEANIDAAIHVAHASTVHGQETESDYFSVVDDLKADNEDAGAAHIGETELNAGLFYGYVVIDRAMLLDNLGGDADMAAAVTRRLIETIATVSPGAKLGSTAPYSWAPWMLIEAGDRQPRSLAEAFRTPCAAATQDAEGRARDHLERLDGCYGGGEARREQAGQGEGGGDGEGQRQAGRGRGGWGGC